MTWKDSSEGKWAQSVDNRRDGYRPSGADWSEDKSGWNKKSKWADEWNRADNITATPTTNEYSSKWGDRQWKDDAKWDTPDAAVGESWGSKKWETSDAAVGESWGTKKWETSDAAATDPWRGTKWENETAANEAWGGEKWENDATSGGPLISKSYGDWAGRKYYGETCFLFGALDWSKVLPSLPPFEKDFYIPHPTVENRTNEQVAEILHRNKIQIIPSEHVPVVIVKHAERPAAPQLDEEVVPVIEVYSNEAWSWSSPPVHEQPIAKDEQTVVDGVNVADVVDVQENTPSAVDVPELTGVDAACADAPGEHTDDAPETLDSPTEDEKPVEASDTLKNHADDALDAPTGEDNTIEAQDTLDAPTGQTVVYGNIDARPVPKPVTTLMEASFPEYITAKLFQLLGDLTPTGVQMLMWPVALSGRDCLAVAPTGTGKTLGYLLPAIVHISAQSPVVASDQSPIVLVIAPTRELTAQIMEQANLYGSAITQFGGQALTPMSLFGGVPKIDHRNLLEEKIPDFIVATPGRLMDFMKDGVICLRRVTYFVIDEVDRFIREDTRMGGKNAFADNIREISSQIRPDRQCIMCSATCDTSVMSLARDLCAQEPVFFQISEEDQRRKLVVSPNVQQDFIDAGSNYYDRVNYLLKEILPNTFSENLSKTEQKMIIFVNSKKLVDELTSTIREAGWPAIGVSGDKLQEEREWIFKSFKSGAVNILIATDVMSRGMDFENVRCVLNFDLPDEIEDYIHRVGRTGRIGKKILRGYALSFITSNDWYILPGLEKMFEHCNLEIPHILREKILEYQSKTNKY